MDAAVNAHGISAEKHNEMLKFGWWLYIASEVMLFGSMIGAMVFAKSKYESPEYNIPLLSLNTFFLLMSSWMVVRALASVQEGDQVALARALFIAGALGTTFIILQIVEYTELSHHGLTLTSSMYGSTFYMLTGFHGFHVFIGVLWLFGNFFRALNGHFTPDKAIGIEVMGLYWHFVDVVWIVLFTLIYLM